MERHPLERGKLSINGVIQKDAVSNWMTQANAIALMLTGCQKDHFPVLHCDPAAIISKVPPAHPSRNSLHEINCAKWRTNCAKWRNFDANG